MKNPIFMSAVLVLLASSVYFNVSAQTQSKGPTAVAMTGDKDATWILTDENELIYCWWPESPDRLDQQAKCRVLNKYRVDRMQ